MIFTNDHFAAKPSNLPKLHDPGTRKNAKIRLTSKNITDFTKKIDHPGPFFFQKNTIF